MPQDDRRTDTPRRVWPLLGAGALVLLALLSAIVAARLGREPSLPPSPHDASELGPIPVPNEPWQSIVAAEDEWLAVPEESLLRDEFDADLPDARVLRDRAGIVALLVRVERAAMLGMEARVDGAFTGAPLVDGCAGSPSECNGLVLVRAAEQAEVVAVSRWAAGDGPGSARLLAAVMVASMGLARTGRDAMGQVVGLSMLARAVTVAFVLDRIDRSEGRALDPSLAAALGEVGALDVDLGRGWIGESLWVDGALRQVVEHGERRTLLLFDEGAAAREIYDTYEACIAFARGQAPSPPPMASIPGVVDADWRIAPLDALRIIDGIPLECGPVIDVARTKLRIAQDRARRILER